MSSFNAALNGFRMSPRKVRLVVDLVRGRHVQDALDILAVTHKKAAPVLSKLISSAVANASQAGDVDVDGLFVSEAYVGDGPTLKRFCPRAQGRAAAIRKRTSRITIKLASL